MGFLKKLFEKKDCEICGGEIGLLGNTKLADGDMCKECKAKLSPLFRVKSDTTVADILAQIAYRAENEKALETFDPDEEFGSSDKICVDTAAKTFVYARWGDWKRRKADVIAFSQVTGVETEEQDDTTEVDEENEETGETTAREIPIVHFYVTVSVDSPYFDTIELCLSEGETILPPADGDEENAAKYNEYKRQMNRIRELLEAGEAESAPCEEEAPAADVPAAEAEPKICAACGAEGQSGKFCEYCGSAL